MSAEWAAENANCRSRILDSATTDLAQQLLVSSLYTPATTEEQQYAK
jgi:hypothetical protein